MPRMVNGTGTWFCTAHFDAGFGWDDAVECAMFAYMPVWPLRVIHVRIVPGGSFSPENYQAIPLRWSEPLVRHVFLRCWLAGCIGLGILCALLLGAHALSPPQGKAYVAREWVVLRPILQPLTPCLIIGGITGQILIRRSGRRERDIRLLLGVHGLGSSDPATWLDEDLARMTSAPELFGTETYAAAVPQLLQADAWAGAMWAARLSAAREDATIGEALTSEVLKHPGPLDALKRYRFGAITWGEATGVTALEQYRAQHSLAQTQPLFQLSLIEQFAKQKSTEQHDGAIAGVAAIFALVGVGLGAWLGSMISISLALLLAVGGSLIGAIAGALLANAIANRR